MIERWRQLRPVEEVAAGGAAEIAAEAAGAAQRMGAEGRAEPLTEEEIAAKRVGGERGLQGRSFITIGLRVLRGE